MASSVVEIWNLGLIRIGEEQVVDEDENSANAEILRAAWPTQRDRMFEDFDWEFARRYGALTPISDATELVDGWTYAYQWPQGDMISFRGVANPVFNAVDPIPYATMLLNAGLDKKILTDLDEANGFWTERVVDVSRYPASFVYALSFAMQAEVIGSVSREGSAKVQAAQFFKQSADLAKVATAKQGEPRTPEDTSPRSIAARA